MGELKKRSISSIILFFITFSASYNYSDDIISYLIYNISNATIPIITISPLEIVYSKFYVSSILAILLSVPLLIINFYYYIKPALYEKEKEILKIVLFPCSAVFIIGFTLFLFIGVPNIIYFISTFAVTGVNNSISLMKFIHFIVCCCSVAGIMSCYPIFIYLSNSIGIVNKDLLKKYRKHTIVIAFIAGALLTPPDIITQCLIALPLILLHELSILLIRR